MKILSDSRLMGCVLAIAVMAGPLKAQEPRYRACEVDGTCAAWWASELAIIGVNGLIGGLTAGIWQELRGGSFSDGFARGSLGGVVGCGGKRLATGRFPGAGLIGREVGAIGHSIVRNAADGRGMLSRVSLPLLFLPARVQLGDWSDQFVIRLDAMAFSTFVSGIVDGRLHLDFGRSLSWGAAVFVSDLPFHIHDRVISGAAAEGTVWVYRELLARPGAPRIAAHERVHVVQNDFPIIAWSDPSDHWLASLVPGGRSITRFVAPNAFALLYSYLQGAVSSRVDHYHRPWELEAIVLDGGL